MPRLIDPDPPALGFLVSRSQALAEGLSDGQIQHRVRSGQWQALQTGMYLRRIAGPPGADPYEVERVEHALRAAAAVRRHDRASVAFQSAAVVDGLPLVSPVPDHVQMAVPPGSWTGIRDGVRYRQLLLADKDVVDAGARRTCVARTWVDVARTLPLADALATGDRALRNGTLDVHDVATILERIGRVRGRRRAAAALPLLDGRRETALESWSSARFHAWDLPTPEYQKDFWDEDGFVGRSDFWWAHARVVGKADGQLKYADREDVYAEKRREDRLRALGLTVIRWGWGDLAGGGLALERRLRSALRR